MTPSPLLRGDFSERGRRAFPEEAKMKRTSDYEGMQEEICFFIGNINSASKWQRQRAILLPLMAFFSVQC